MLDPATNDPAIPLSVFQAQQTAGRPPAALPFGIGQQRGFIPGGIGKFPPQVFQ